MLCYYSDSFIYYLLISNYMTQHNEMMQICCENTVKCSILIVNSNMINYKILHTVMFSSLSSDCAVFSHNYFLQCIYCKYKHVSIKLIDLLDVFGLI